MPPVDVYIPMYMLRIKATVFVFNDSQNDRHQLFGLFPLFPLFDHNQHDKIKEKRVYSSLFRY